MIAISKNVWDFCSDRDKSLISWGVHWLSFNVGCRVFWCPTKGTMLEMYHHGGIVAVILNWLGRSDLSDLNLIVTNQLGTEILYDGPRKFATDHKCLESITWVL